MIVDALVWWIAHLPHSSEVKPLNLVCGLPRHSLHVAYVNVYVCVGVWKKSHHHGDKKARGHVRLRACKRLTSVH